MNYSRTYAAAIVGLLAFILRTSGIEVHDEELMEAVTSLLTVASFATILYERWKKGDVTMTGVKTPKKK